jgi:predicted AlkP superfamily pyrophosphatase or phosphodiesterase
VKRRGTLFYYSAMRGFISLLFWILCACASVIATASPKAQRHVVMVVWDGMRPDFVSEQNTPTLWKLAREGVTFRKHHAVYPSATMVNGTALVTGVYPGRNGIIANHLYRPDIDPHHAIDVELRPMVKKGDEVSRGKYILAPTIAELVQRARGRTVIATAKSVGLLLDRQADVGAAKNCVTLFAGNAGLHARSGAPDSMPAEIVPSITATLGPFPSGHLQQDAWTTKALTDCFWKDGVPALSVLWLGEPDLTQHESAPGAPAALAAIKSADENLAVVLSALDQRDARRTTDVFVVSDHGFSTIERSVDLRKILNDAGFTAKTEFNDQAKPGDIVLAGNGGSVLFYVIGHNQTLIRRLVEFLQQSDFAGVIFTKKPMEGTFGLDQATIQNPHGPDVEMSFRWNDSKNQFGIPGMIDADWQRKSGEGTHVTLSRFDMHNTLIAAGPDFKRGETDDLPSGNVDLAPTILQILGIQPPTKMDGRILSEAIAARVGALRRPDVTARRPYQTNTIEATKRFPTGTWRQSLQISRIGSTIYLDEGNGAFVASEGAASELESQRRPYDVNWRVAVEPDRK